MYESVKAGKIVEMVSKSTLSDGTAGGIEPDSITFELTKENVDEYVVVSEEEIKEAIRIIFEKHFMIIEGAAALSVASFIKCKNQFENQIVVLVISGAKMSLEKLREVFC